MMDKVTRMSVVLLGALLLTLPAFPQDSKDNPDQPKLTATQVKAQKEQQKKDAEQKKREAEQAKKEEEAKKKKHADVENIGNRDINKRSINFTSIEKEIAMGRQFAAEVDRQVKFVEDPTINEYVNRVGQNIVRN